MNRELVFWLAETDNFPAFAGMKALESSVSSAFFFHILHQLTTPTHSPTSPLPPQESAPPSGRHPRDSRLGIPPTDNRDGGPVLKHGKNRIEFGPITALFSCSVLTCASQSLIGSALGLGTDWMRRKRVSGSAASVRRIFPSPATIFNW